MKGSDKVERNSENNILKDQLYQIPKFYDELLLLKKVTSTQQKI
jgi:hypothetical protein